ncbi:MAG: tetratricopeptide repeat protein [Chitinophagaceae bacterium]|nr:tetratricopeptide repeat protein [Chitinophagaceae bacterium]
MCLSRWFRLFFLLVCNIFLQPAVLLAQRQEVDSLVHALSGIRNDSIRLEVKRDIAFAMYRYAPDSAMLWATEGLNDAEKIQNQHGISMMSQMIGTILTRMGQYNPALTSYLKALKIREELGIADAMASTQNNIGIVYIYLKDYDQALQSFRLADSLIQQFPDDDLNYSIRLNFGEAFEKKNRPDSAMLQYQLAQQWALNYQDVYRQAKAGLGLGNVLLKQRKFQDALGHYRFAFRILLVENDEDLCCEALLGMAKCYDVLGPSDSALYTARAGIQLARKDQFLSREQDLSHFLSDFFARHGQMDSAFRYQQREIALKDSALGMEQLRISEQITFQEKLRQIDLKEKQRKEQEERKNQLQHILIMMFIPTLFLVTLILARRRVKLGVIKFLGILSLLFFFEYITLLLHPVVQHVTHHTPVFEILIFVGIAALIIPTHHKIEHWLIALLVKRVHGPEQGINHTKHTVPIKKEEGTSEAVRRPAHKPKRHKKK